MTTPAPPDRLPDDLPAVIHGYQEAHDRRDTDAALATFAPDAVVHDDGHQYHGTAEIRTWLATASTEFNYTRTLTGAEPIDTTTWLVSNHLEGDFPGGTVDLHYRFVLTGDLIAELVIAPPQRPPRADPMNHAHRDVGAVWTPLRRSLGAPAGRRG